MFLSRSRHRVSPTRASAQGPSAVSSESSRALESSSWRDSRDSGLRFYGLRTLKFFRISVRPIAAGVGSGEVTNAARWRPVRPSVFVLRQRGTSASCPAKTLMPRRSSELLLAVDTRRTSPAGDRLCLTNLRRSPIARAIGSTEGAGGRGDGTSRMSGPTSLGRSPHGRAPDRIPPLDPRPQKFLGASSALPRTTRGPLGARHSGKTEPTLTYCIRFLVT